VLVRDLPREPRTGGGSALASATAPPSFFKITATFGASPPPPSLGAGGLEVAWVRYCQPHPSGDLSSWRRCTGDRENYGGDALNEGAVDVEDVTFSFVQARQGGQLIVEAGSFPPHPQERIMCRSLSQSQCPSTRVHCTPPIARLVSPPARSIRN
jgi:hypothetical protein